MKNNFRIILAKQKNKISDVHEATGLSIYTLTNIYYERAKNPKYDTIKRITDFLNCSFDDFLDTDKFF